MISRFNGKCVYCKEPTKAGVDQYDVVQKISYHEACQVNRDVSDVDEESGGELADQLGFQKEQP